MYYNSHEMLRDNKEIKSKTMNIKKQTHNMT